MDVVHHSSSKIYSSKYTDGVCKKLPDDEIEGADVFLKNLIILLIIIASSSDLGVRLKLKLKVLNLGPEKRSSRLGLMTVPVALVITFAPTA